MIDPKNAFPAAKAGGGFDWSRLLDSPSMDDPEDMRSGFEQEDRSSETLRSPGK